MADKKENINNIPSEIDESIDKQHDKGKTTVAGYTMGDIVSSVSTPPEPTGSAEKPSKARPSYVVRILVVIGIGLVALGALFWLVKAVVAVSLAILGILIILAGLTIVKAVQKV